MRDPVPSATPPPGASDPALGSDVMTAALEGYALLKVSGKGVGLDALRQGMSARFTRKSKMKPVPAA